MQESSFLCIWWVVNCPIRCNIPSPHAFLTTFSFLLLHFILFLHLQSMQCTQSFLTAVLWAVGSISAMLTYDFPFTLLPFVFEKVKREWPGKANAWLLPISPVCGHWEPVWCLKPITSTQSTHGEFSNAMDLSIISVDRKWPLYDGMCTVEMEKMKDEIVGLMSPSWSNLASSICMCRKRLALSKEQGCYSLLQCWKEFSTAASSHIILSQKTEFLPLLPI